MVLSNPALVRTKQFELEEKVYFKILIRTRLKDHWWFYLIIFLVILWNLNEFGNQPYATTMVVLGFIYPFFSFFYLYYWATSPRNRSVYLKRTMEFNEEYMQITVEDGTENKIPFKKIVKSIETRTFFLIYLSNSQFIYIPKNSFKNHDDVSLFQTKLHDTLKNTGSSDG